MKKALLILLLIITHNALSQSTHKPTGKVAAKRFEFNLVETDTKSMTTHGIGFNTDDTALYRAFEFLNLKNDGTSKIRAESPIMLGAGLSNTVRQSFVGEVASITKTYHSYIIPDSSKTTLVALGITPQNVKDYRYHVVQNDSIELVPWSAIPRTEQKYGAKKPYAFLGNYKYPGSRVMIEVVNIKNYSIRDGVIFDWRINMLPTVTEIEVGNRHNYYNLNKVNNHLATKFDKQTGLPLDFKFPIDSVEAMSLALKNHETVPYAIDIVSNTNGKIDTTGLEWWYLLNHYNIENKHFSKPGKYILIIQPVCDPAHADPKQQIRIPFEVLPPPILQKKVSLKDIFPYVLAAILIIGLIFWGYRRNNRLKLERSHRAQETLNLKLRSIRSQLNPHFMFNALTSIQNLVNKSDIPAANHYLTLFADLTRKVLNTSDGELISMDDELKILEDYLQMEQLRFGFKYEINVDDTINIANTEIPAMLLQPFVENAIKHGVAVLHDNGLVSVDIKKQANNIVLSVTDNGKGFDPEQVRQNKTSFGLKLSEERIALLNQVNKSQPVTFNIDTKASGKRITITLVNLLS